MAKRPKQTKKEWADGKMKLKSIFATYIIGIMLYLGTDIFLDNMNTVSDLMRGMFIFGTAVISAIVYIVIAPKEFDLEDKQDEVLSNKEVRFPETLVNIIKNIVESIMVNPEDEIKSLDQIQLEKLNKNLEKWGPGDPQDSEKKIAELEAQLASLKAQEKAISQK